MKSMIQLNKEIFRMKFPWNLWVALLGGINMVGGLVYIRTFEGQLALASLMAAFVIMWAIYVKKGFVRLLGLGHLLAWMPQMAWFARTVAQGEVQGAFHYWLIAVLAMNGTAMLIDLVDVVRYSLGEKQPMTQ